MPRIAMLQSAEQPFPHPSRALRHPNGLLAAGGDLSPERLINAYRHGIFPWYEDPQPVLWWSPDPRMVLYPEEIRISRSLRKRLRQGHFRVTADTAMEAVIDGCAAPRAGTDDTWIGSDMRKAYLELHRQGYVHSIETWLEGELVGGLYGLCLGRVFFGESMFSRSTDASKVALVHLSNQLREWGFAVIDCQQETPHLQSMGARNITREEFLVILDAACDEEGMHRNRWTMDWTYTEDEWGNQRRF